MGPEKLYYHGTDPRNIHSILTKGFALGEERAGRVHGYGLYIATKPETAAHWADRGFVHQAQFAFKCRLQPGTKILWKEVDYDKGVIRYLEKEYHKKISQNYDFWKYIPSNKRLTNSELRALVSHLDYTTIRKGWGRKRNKIEDVKYKHMSRFSKIIRQYGYDAFGDRTEGCWDSDEILVYNPSKVVPVSLHRITVEWDRDIWTPKRVDYSHPLSVEKAKQISEDEEASWKKWEEEDAAAEAAENQENGA